MSNSDEDDEEIKLLMAYENDVLEKEDFLKEITQLKICLVEKDTIIDRVTHQLTEKDNQNEVLECEVVIIGKELEKTKTLNLRFAKGSEMLYEIIKVQHSPLIKTGLGFHETVKGESSLQDEVMNFNENSKTLNMEIIGQPHQQPRKERLQRKSFPPNYGSDNCFFPLKNNVECFVCHNFGHVAARYRSRMVQDSHTKRSSISMYFKGYCFSCNMLGHKAIDCDRGNIKCVRCYACNKF